jgi:hypothetical protein
LVIVWKLRFGHWDFRLVRVRYIQEVPPKPWKETCAIDYIKPLKKCHRPNTIWSAAFKGKEQFKIEMESFLAR